AGVGVADLERVERLVAQPLELGLGEGRLAHDLGDEAERGAEARRRHRDRDEGLAPAGAAVERAAERLGRGGDLGAGAMARALREEARGHRREPGTLRRVELAAGE